MSPTTPPGGGQLAGDGVGLCAAVNLFKFVWRTIAQGTVQAMWVVPAFDKGEQRQTRLVVRREAATCQQFALERGEEGFTHGIGVRRQLRP